ncbi:alpha/beta hydrolase [Paenibacillus durus]|uniref:alpha/beta hydrolase n=1 Tax=Paenibacillus durus TaxID=44251 RepID=UPI0004B4901E|nr:alpha/beta hydrolase [Paenibacillus durus]
MTIQSNSVPIVLSIWKSNELDPCIIFIPGTATHPLFYEKFLGLLSLHGFNVIGVHPVCHGKSPRVKELFTFDEMIQNGRDAITYATQRFNEQIYLMGSSQGGILTIALAGLDHRIRAAFPHNILIPSLPDSVDVTRFPRVMKYFYKPFIGGMKLGCKLFPRLKIPVGFYLDLERVTSNDQILDQLRLDPIGFMSYPLYFLTSLFSADLKQIQDGSIKCPVYVMASKGDPLFPFDYTRKVFQLIQAPYKELMVFEENCHLLLNESGDQTMNLIIMKVKNAVNDLMRKNG